jgi:hypothetical protein
MSLLLIGSNSESTEENSSAFSWCERHLVSTWYQWHLETGEVCLGRLQERPSIVIASQLPHPKN